jgi:hypothetical protein
LDACYGPGAGMTGVEVTITLGYPDSLDTDPVQVALAQLDGALSAFEGVRLLCASARLIEEES